MLAKARSKLLELYGDLEKVGGVESWGFSWSMAGGGVRGGYTVGGGSKLLELYGDLEKVGGVESRKQVAKQLCDHLPPSHLTLCVSVCFCCGRCGP